jgi:hypothetical protein
MAMEQQQQTLPLSKRNAPKRKGRPYGFAAALALILQHGRERPAPAAPPLPTKRCPRCSRVGRIDQQFGYRMIDGERRPQSWCRECRAGQGEAKRQQQALALDPQGENENRRAA